MRAFYALPIPKDTIKKITTSLTDVRNGYPKLAWVRSGAMHITLHFLGEIGDSLVRHCVDVLNRPALQIPSFTVAYRGVGAFPSIRKPRVFYLRLTEGYDSCTKLYSVLEERLPSEIKTESRAFTPHITITRVKKGGAAPPIDRFPEIEGAFIVDRCVLYRSILKPTGAEYREVAEAILQ